MHTTTPPRALLFDLDGTLLDTAGDLATALNALLAEEGRAPLPYGRIRLKVSHGSTALVSIAFPELSPDQPGQDAPFEALRARLLAHYRRDLATHTRLFPGLAAVLDCVEARGLPWGVVTNKPGWLTEPLLEQLDLRRRAATVICGDTFPERKPHPRPLLAAASALGLAPADCLYVGDALRDIQAARSAGMRSLVARFGYIAVEDQDEDWPADGWIERPDELLNFLSDSPWRELRRE